MSKKDLFKPTLTEDNTISMESYNIKSLFYVAFFGGVIPTIWLGTKNAKLLNIDKKKINLLIATGIIFLSIKMLVIWMSFSGLLIVSRRIITWTYRGLTLILYLGYYLGMKKEYDQHVFFGGKIRSMGKEWILPFVVGIIVEFTLVLIITFLTGVI